MHCELLDDDPNVPLVDRKKKRINVSSQSGVIQR
jgi:hypothetical protein